MPLPIPFTPKYSPGGTHLPLPLPTPVAKIHKCAVTGKLTHKSCQAVARTEDGTPDQLSFLSSSACIFLGRESKGTLNNGHQENDEKKATTTSENQSEAT